jgi:hypothetical protein
MNRRIVGRGSHQLIDVSPVSTQSAAASTSLGAAVLGTVWPLLPDNAYRIFNVSAGLSADAGQLVKVQTFQININLLDSGGNTVAYFTLAAENYTDPALIGGNAGFAVEKNGDPIIEFFANLNAVGTPYESTNVAAFQAEYNADVFNTDAVNAHNVTIFGAVLFSVGAG